MPIRWRVWVELAGTVDLGLSLHDSSSTGLIASHAPASLAAGTTTVTFSHTKDNDLTGGVYFVVGQARCISMCGRARIARPLVERIDFRCIFTRS